LIYQICHIDLNKPRHGAGIVLDWLGPRQVMVETASPGRLFLDAWAGTRPIAVATPPWRLSVAAEMRY
jgi:hypothetical protein